MADALETEATDYTFLRIHLLDIASPFRGKSGRNVELVFQIAEAMQPTIIYLRKKIIYETGQKGFMGEGRGKGEILRG